MEGTVWDLVEMEGMEWNLRDVGYYWFPFRMCENQDKCIFLWWMNNSLSL